MTSVQHTPAFISLLRDKGVDKVMVIDDAYDMPWPLHYGEVRDFWTEIDADDTARQLLWSLVGMEINTEDEINEEVVAILWERYHNNDIEEPLKGLCVSVLFSTAIEKRAQVDRFTGHLREAAIEPILSGKEVTLPDIPVPIIFIDYYMGVDNDSNAVQTAKRIARDIYNKYPNPHKPLIILMSSVPGVERMKEEFRDDSGLLGGMFYFVPKDDLIDRNVFFLRLGAWVKNLHIGHDVQGFIDALERSVKEVTQTFLRNVRKLSIEDYAYIQNLSLQKDGHPLGDYMLWLYGSYLQHLLFENNSILRSHQAEMDLLDFPVLPLSQSTPSLQLVEIYKNALFEQAGAVSGHPRTVRSQDNNSLDPYLHLGDLFINEAQDRVWLVINADCDLAMTPDDKRKIPPDQSILLVPGILQPLSRVANELGSVRTELFEYNNESYRIVWQIKKVISCEYGHMHMWMSAMKSERVARLRQPYALEVQRAFAADFTRIGMPVAPPFYRSIKVQLLYKNVQDQVTMLMEPHEGMAFVVLAKERENQTDKLVEKCVFTTDFACKLKTTINTIISALQATRQNPGTNGSTPARKIQKQLNKLTSFHEQFDTWFLELAPLELPKREGAQPLVESLLDLGRYPETLNEMKSGALFLLNIIDTTTPEKQGTTMAQASLEEEKLNGMVEVSTEKDGGQDE